MRHLNNCAAPARLSSVGPCPPQLCSPPPAPPALPLFCSNWGLCNLVLALLLEQQKASLPVSNAGHLLLGFLKYFGRVFDLEVGVFCFLGSSLRFGYRDSKTAEVGCC